MQPRTLAVLLLLVIGLGGFIFFYEKDLPSTDERREQQKKVLRIEQDDVRGLTIEWPDGKVRLERQATWRLVEPRPARADRSAVDGVLSSLAGLEKKRTLEDVDRADVGLEEPEVEVTLATGEGETVLSVGAEVPASSDRLVAVGGRAEVYQVSGGFVDDLTKDPGEWRDKKLFTGARNDIQRLTLTSGESQVLLAKRGEDFWIESPLADRADSDHVNTLLSEITGLRVREFLDQEPLDPAAIGLEPPRRVLEAILEGSEEPFRLELGLTSEGENAFYGRAEGQLFDIETRLEEALDRPASAWRSRAWTELQVFKIESARLVDEQGELQVVRDGSDWKRGEERIDYTTASDLLYAITDAGAEEVVERRSAEERGHDFAEPLLTVHLATADGEEELHLYPPVDGLAAATSSVRDAVLLMSEETVDKIQQAAADLRQAEPLPDEGEGETSEAGEEADGP